ncbi:MAG: hypothetical protein COS90_09665 [Deltaproteobacteria bacterium CG07_land_8_20_14_0_80_60_11]|nr:MAG: hypothetical protein COS90_09665 [Deltaproteobacteria bacterium CG07_land_8_20_14_0_80_60_11]
MITAGLGGAMEPPAPAGAGPGCKACAPIIVAAPRLERQRRRPSRPGEPAFMLFPHLVINRDRMQA